jgi:hypothetical protein
MERFWSKVNLAGPLISGMETRCWEWKATRNGDGYGSFWLLGSMRGAHRVAYELEREPIAAGMTLDHLCRNRCCVNPAHLDPVPLRVNVLRGGGTGARNARKDRCPQGHRYTPDNTYRSSRGDRKCRTCTAERNRARGTR